MKNRNARKLQLNRNTVRTLDRDALPQVAGGTLYVAASTDPLCTIDCPPSQLIRCRR